MKRERGGGAGTFCLLSGRRWMPWAGVAMQVALLTYCQRVCRHAARVCPTGAPVTGADFVVSYCTDSQKLSDK